ncbi:hypothetical protein NMG60_11001303 [Bertholletia excelsa]
MAPYYGIHVRNIATGKSFGLRTTLVRSLPYKFSFEDIQVLLFSSLFPSYTSHL